MHIEDRLLKYLKYFHPISPQGKAAVVEGLYQERGEGVPAGVGCGWC